MFYYFTMWKREGVFEDIMNTLSEKLHIVLGREESPSVGIIDSRSAKTSQHVNKECGIDGNKKIKGRKHQVVVDMLGLPMDVSVHMSNNHNSRGAESALKKLANKLPRLRNILADSGYRGDEKRETTCKMLGCQFEVVLRPDESPKMFNVIPLRWIIKRSFAWLYNFKRVALDYEFYSESTEAMIQIAFLKIILYKLSN